MKLKLIWMHATYLANEKLNSMGKDVTQPSLLWKSIDLAKMLFTTQCTC